MLLYRLLFFACYCLLFWFENYSFQWQLVSYMAMSHSLCRDSFRIEKRNQTEKRKNKLKHIENQIWKGIDNVLYKSDKSFYEKLIEWILVFDVFEVSFVLKIVCEVCESSWLWQQSCKQILNIHSVRLKMQFVILTAFDMLINNCVHANFMPLPNKRQINQITTNFTIPHQKKKRRKPAEISFRPIFFVHFEIAAYHSKWFILISIDKLDVCSTWTGCLMRTNQCIHT